MGKVMETLRGFRRPKQTDLEEYLKKLSDRGLDRDGKLIPDPTPIAPPIGFKKTPSMVEIVRNMVRSERLAAEARAAGAETFEESEDFDVGDDGPDLTSGFENDFDPPIPEIRKAVEEERLKNAPPPVVPAEPAKPAKAVPPSDGPGTPE